MNKMRKLGIDYGDARVGLAITDELGITAQGLETIHHNGNDKIVLKRLEELFNKYNIDTIVINIVNISSLFFNILYIIPIIATTTSIPVKIITSPFILLYILSFKA